MKLQQLRYLVEIAQLQSISAAAESLCTSQSGISKQIMLLEQELKVTLFVRKGRYLTGLTPAGKEIHHLAEQVLSHIKDIKLVAQQLNNEPGSLTIATTHTQARYVLPYVVERFLKEFPDTGLHIHQGTPEQVSEMLARGDVDVAIATEALVENPSLVAMPCYQWNRCIIVKRDHPLTKISALSLAEIARYPIITYVSGFTGRHKVDEAFSLQGLSPDIVLAAVDADVIKTYVRLGLGIGIIANMALSVEQDKDLVAMDCAQLFGSSVSQIAIKKDTYIRKSIYRFVEMFAPHLTENIVKLAAVSPDAKSRQELFVDFSIPVYRLPEQ